jgi:small conductance mechanosensitive channel
MTFEELYLRFGPTILDWTTRFAGAIAMLVAGWLVSGWSARQTRVRLEAAELLDATLRPLAARLVRVVLLVITFVAVLNRFGVETTSIVALIGAAGIAIGLALQGTLSNVAAGIVLVVLRPFRVGDAIEVGGQATGVVREIGLFATELKQADGVYVLIPNSQVWGTVIRNFSRNELRRMEISFVVPHGSDTRRALELLGEVAQLRDATAADPAPTAFVGPIDHAGITLTVWAWTTPANFGDEQPALRTALHAALVATGIAIARPVREVIVSEKFSPSA